MKSLDQRMSSAVAAAVGTLFAAGAAMAAPGGTPQASITLQNSDAEFCYTQDNTWDVTKEVTGNTIDAVTGIGNVTWTVTATKNPGGSAPPPKFCVVGGLTIYNSGSAPASIGNIVVNLQKPNSPKKGGNASYVSIAANVADATRGDAATSAKIVAAASQEVMSTNQGWLTNNYTVSGAVGTFVQTSCSGTLEFTDGSDNTAFSLVPQPSIPVGKSITLLYKAEFNVNCLPLAGTPLRVEALVSFGNAGARGGSGATATSIDINGNGSVNSDEANVRTVPSRVTMAALPAAPEQINGNVSLSDVVTTTGTVSVANVVSDVPATTDVRGSWTVSADVSPGTAGGRVCNTVYLDGTAQGGTLSVVVQHDTGVPAFDALGNQIGWYADFECVAAAEDEASACVDVTPPSNSDVKDGDYCSFSQGGLGGSGEPYNRLAANFTTMYPSGVEAGIPGAGGFSMTFNSAAAVKAYLPAGGEANPLTADSVNPTSTSSGQFGGQVLALKLNIALSDNGTNPTGFGDLLYCDAASSLNGQTVRQILAAAETALGGGALPAGYDYPSIAGLAANLDLSFDLKDETYSACGVATAWAKTFLKKGACQ